MPDMFLVWDRKARAALGPVFPARSDDEAKRVFLGLAQNKETLVAQYPADFELWFLFSLGEGQPEPVLRGYGVEDSSHRVQSAEEALNDAR